MTQQTLNDVLSNSLFEICFGHGRRIEEGSSILAPIEQVLFEQAIKGSHERRVSDPLIKRFVNIANARFSAPPDLVQHLSFETAKRETCHFTWPAKST